MRPHAGECPPGKQSLFVQRGTGVPPSGLNWRLGSDSCPGTGWRTFSSVIIQAIHGWILAQMHPVAALQQPVPNHFTGAKHAKRVLPRTGRNLGSEVAASASPSTLLGALTHSTPAQGHPEPVERMSLSNGRADGRFQIHSLALVAPNQMLFPRR